MIKRGLCWILAASFFLDSCQRGPYVIDPLNEEVTLNGSKDFQSLNGTWQIVFDRNDEGREKKWTQKDNFPEEGVKDITVPVCWELIEKDYEGVAFYRRIFRVPADWKGRTVRLHFDAVNFRADVWLNNTAVGFHEGGFTPFEFEVGDLLKSDKENTLILRLVGPVFMQDKTIDGMGKMETPQWRGAITGGIWQPVSLIATGDVYVKDVFTEKALGFIKKAIDEDHPFYVQINYHAVHAPLEPRAPDQYYNRFDAESFVLNNFYAHVFAVDESVRKLDEYLEKRGAAGNTMLIFTSDNGGAVGGRSSLPGNAPYVGQKGMYALGGIRTPLVFYWPEGTDRPHVNRQLVSTLDILPTIIDAAGMEVPEGLDGKSLLACLQKTNHKAVHEYLLWSGIHARAWGFMSYNSLLPHLEAWEKAPSSWMVIKDGWMLRYIDDIPGGLYKDLPGGKSGTTELFDIRKDCKESENLLELESGKSEELDSLWNAHAKYYPPPVKWKREKWESLVPDDNRYISDGMNNQ